MGLARFAFCGGEIWEEWEGGVFGVYRESFVGKGFTALGL